MLLALLLAAAPSPKLVAVLELASKLPADAQVDRAFFSDRVRRATLQALPGANVMTRENMEVLAQQRGKDLASCEGECEVETGRTLGADYVVSGELLRVGAEFALSLRLHDTAQGRLLAVEQALGKDPEALLAAADASVAALFKPLSTPRPPAQAAATSGGPVVSATRYGYVSFALSGTAHPGGDLECRALQDPGAEACRYECANDVRCRAFTWSSRDASCCLKSRVTPPGRDVPGLVYGERRTPAPVIALSFSRLFRLALQGSDFRRVRAASADACQRVCAADLRCVGFTFTRGSCALKNRVTGARRQRAAVSGQRR